MKTESIIGLANSIDFESVRCAETIKAKHSTLTCASDHRRPWKKSQPQLRLALSLAGWSNDSPQSQEISQRRFDTA